MKRILSVLLFIFFIPFSNAQTRTNSVLSSGNWFKFSVDTTGVFKIDKNLLQRIGISTNGLNPKKIHIYGNGGTLLPELNSATRYDGLQENAIFIQGENDESFDNSDFILFYAKGPHDWVVNNTLKTASHRQNIYSDKAYYFITVNETDGKRIQAKAQNSNSSLLSINTYDDFTVLEEEGLNILGTGTQWFFNTDFNVENVQNFSIPFPNAVANEPITITTAGVSTSTVVSFMQVKIDGSDLYNVTFGAVSTEPNSTIKAVSARKTSTINNSSESINVEISYDNNGNPSAKTYLDYIEVIGKKNLKANEKQFSFRSFEQFEASGTVTFEIEHASKIFQVWDVSDFISPKLITNESTGNNFTFKDVARARDKNDKEILREYILLSETDFYIPETIQDSKVENQNLHALADINYMIITNTELSSEAQRLADYHQENSGFTTQVVVLEDIYNEFSSGSKDITGIRDFIKHIYNGNSSSENKLKFICFFGDASYDYKDRIPANNNIVPVKLSTKSFDLANSFVTDDYYVMLEPNEGNNLENQSAGDYTLNVVSSRIPVSTISQANDVVSKILSYYNESALGDWRNTITFLADDIDEGSDTSIQSGLESIAKEVNATKPLFNINKIYADSYVQQNSSGGGRYPEVKEAITNAIEKGTLVFDYFGHGGEDGFASERILEKPQIQSLVNNKTLPLLITVTCDFSRFDNPNRITAGELTFWNKNGGAASMITTTREVYITTGQRFNRELIKVLLEFGNEDLTIAESLTMVKNNFTDRENQEFFIFSFGDPAMKLAIPELNVKITKMNGKDLSQPLDTLKALSKISFEGIVANNADVVLTDFNGSLSTTVFDKPIERTTLDNDDSGVTMKFETQDSKLFRGKSTVKNGAFSFEFIVPKDIKIAPGNGKLSFYAENGKTDKSGFNAEIIIGGINVNAPIDNVGPEIQLFMNDESFIDGANTNTSPNLIAFLSDPSGINTSITAIDHDIVGVLDGDTTNPIILNDFYQTELDDFTKGKVTYRFRDLAVGPHTLKVKAWDTYNNPSEFTLNFVVVSDAILNLENVLNYPNPFVNYTEFWFNHNKPNEELEVQVQIFTVSGKLIKTINRTLQTQGNLSRSISWNGLDDFGNKIGKGVYIYKLRVKSTASNLVSEKYEKLVILQ